MTNDIGANNNQKCETECHIELSAIRSKVPHHTRML